MNFDDLYTKALNLELLTAEEGIHLFKYAPLAELMFIANELRKNRCPMEK